MPDPNVKVETYVKVIIELGVSEARSLLDALATIPLGDPSDPIHDALAAELIKVDKVAA
jgi:hypothetical protein